MSGLNERKQGSRLGQLKVILYEETSPEQCRDLESIEATVRHQVTEYVSPQIGIFLSNEQAEQVPEEAGH